MEPGTRKRARLADSPDSDESKRRGRPRVDKKDESAADRRRTQIRLAQRAYRQRKESTLDELRQQVADLTKTVDRVGKTFTQYKNRLAASGISPAQRQDLEKTATRIDVLIQSARTQPESSVITPPPEDEAVEQVSKSAEPPAQHPPVQPTNVPSWQDRLEYGKAQRQMGPTEIGMGYSIVASNSFHPSLNTPDAELPSSMAFMRPTRRLSRDLEQGSISEKSSPYSIPAELKLPATYSFQETTLGRRIHRATLEAAYRVICNPAGHRAALERAFRITLAHATHDQIAKSIRNSLNRGPHESLDMENVPLVALGGAGTHYPKRDQFGNLIQRTLTHAQGAHEDKSHPDIDLAFDKQGLEGEWFDSYDVQGYLEEKGIFIDPMSSFAEIALPEPSVVFSNSPTASSATLPSLNAPGSPFAGNTTPLSATAVLDSDWNGLMDAPLTDIGFSDALTGSWLNFLQPGEAAKQHRLGEVGSNGYEDHASSTIYPQADLSDVNMGSVMPFHVPQQTPRRKQVVVIDVGKFVTTLIHSAVCLGRTPGYRRRDVDLALASAVFDSF